MLLNNGEAASTAPEAESCARNFRRLKVFMVIRTLVRLTTSLPSAPFLSSAKSPYARTNNSTPGTRPIHPAKFLERVFGHDANRCRQHVRRRNPADGRNKSSNPPPAPLSQR